MKASLSSLSSLPRVRTAGILACALLLLPAARSQTILGSTGSYGVMGGGVVTVTGGGTTITGNLGAGSLVGTVTFGSSGALVSPITAQNITDFNAAYTGLSNLAGATDLTGSVLGADAGATVLLPGTYAFTTAAALTGNLVLDANHQANAVWVFQMSSTFNTSDGSTVTVANAAGDSVANYGVFWQVSGASVFGANTLFEGNLLDGSTLSIGAGVNVNHGRLLTATGTIGLASDTIDFGSANSGYSGGLAFDGGGNLVATAVPEPATNALIAAVATLGFVFWRRRRAAA